MAHTKGPWIADGCAVLCKKDRWQIAAALGQPGEDGDNATLIAAVPDLLAACEASLELYNEQLRIVLGCGFEEAKIGCAVGKKLRAAIAKARGNPSGDTGEE